MADRAPGSAHVGSSDAIVDYRAALLTFLDEVSSAMESIQMKAGKALRWLDEDAPAYWKREQQTAYDAVAAARTELVKCRTITVAGRKKSCIEEKKALQRAQARLDLCDAQRSKTRAAAIESHSAADDYRARIGALERFVESELPKLQALLHRTIVALDAYGATRPSTPVSRSSGTSAPTSSTKPQTESTSEPDSNETTSEETGS